MTAVNRKPKVLYSGLLKLSDLYRDINEGFCHFYSANFIEPIQNRENFDFLMCLAPQYYFHLPVVEVVNYFLMKHFSRSLPSMSLTVLHEAISNSLLWGLLRIERPEDFLSMGNIIDEKMAIVQRDHKTIQLGLSIKDGLSFFIINSSDETFSLETLGSSDSPYFRGTDIMKLFGEMDYDSHQKTLRLKLSETHDAQQATPYS